MKIAILSLLVLLFSNPIFADSVLLSKFLKNECNNCGEYRDNNSNLTIDFSIPPHRLIGTVEEVNPYQVQISYPRYLNHVSGKFTGLFYEGSEQNLCASFGDGFVASQVLRASPPRKLILSVTCTGKKSIKTSLAETLQTYIGGIYEINPTYINSENRNPANSKDLFQPQRSEKGKTSSSVKVR